jgi:hypothetical protein
MRVQGTASKKRMPSQRNAQAKSSNGRNISEGMHNQPASGALRFALGCELLAVCLEMLTQHGLTRSELSRLRRLPLSKRAGIPASTKLFNDISDMGRLVSQWADSPEYVDTEGRPKVLPLKGPGPSFAALATRYFPGRSLKELVEIGIATKVLERVGSDKVGHLGACVLLTGKPILLLGHAVRSIRWFLATASHNSGDLGPHATAWPERQAFAELSEDDFEEFLGFVRQPIINFSEMCNRWLMARSGRGRGRGRKIFLGAQAYVFRDR